MGPKRVDTFLAYSMARLIREKETEAFRTYVTDQLWAQGQGKYLPIRFKDALKPSEAIDADAVIDDVASRAGLVITDESSRPSRNNQGG